MYLALLEKTPFLAFDRLCALLVITPLDGISHGRHYGYSCGYCRREECLCGELTVRALEILGNCNR